MPPNITPESDMDGDLSKCPSLALYGLALAAVYPPSDAIHPPIRSSSSLSRCASQRRGVPGSARPISGGMQVVFFTLPPDLQLAF